MEYKFGAYYDDKDFCEVLNFKDSHYTMHELEFDEGILNKSPIDTNSNAFKTMHKENNKKLHDKDVPHTNHRVRMYNKYRDSLFYDFSPHEVLEMILYNCYPRGNTNAIAINLIKHFGNIQNVFRADIDELMLAGLTERSAIVLNQYSELIKYLNYINKPDNIYLSTTQLAGEYCSARFGLGYNEAFHVICLDNSGKVVYSKIISTGDETSTSSYPIKVLRAAMISRTSNIILCHNHPDGNLQPSNDDIINTGRIEKILAAAGFRLIDHIICYRNRFTSFSERGLLGVDK